MRGLLLLGVLMFGSARALADDAAAWLARMDESLARQEFSGVIVFRRGVELDVLRLTSRPGAAGRNEQFERLTGNTESLSRRDGEFRLGEGERWIEQPATASLANPGEPMRLDGPYQLQIAGRDRVAGRDVVIIDVRARDAFRYTQQFLIDEQSGLPLRHRMLALGDSVVEEWLFADIDLELTGEATADVAVSTPARVFPALQPSAVAPPGFQVVDVPSGFVVVKSGAGIDGVGEQAVYSDGLVTVSVYVEPLRSDRANLSGTHRRGALSVVGRLSGGMQIVVVGAIPPATAERFAQGVVLAAGAG